MPLVTTSQFWKNHWKEKAKEPNEMYASGWGARDIKEYLYDLNDITKKLCLKSDDCLLNIGCGGGLMEIVLGYWVKEINSIDFTKEMVERAKRNNAIHQNVKLYVGNILSLSFLENKYSKVLCNSVIQYLNDLEEVIQALKSIKSVCDEKARILISANPDITKQDEFLSGYDKLNLTAQQKKEKKEANEKSLWTDPKEVLSLALDLGFRGEILRMNSGIWQSWYMYDLLLWR